AETADAAAVARRGADPAAHRRAVLRYTETYDPAVAATVSAIVATAADPRFREAGTWQNPRFGTDCLDPELVAPEPRNSRRRRRETAIASYLQRYTTKNDTIGFFGPVGWGSWDPERGPSMLAPGPDLVCRRTVYFEDWTVQAIAATMAQRAEARPG